MPKIDIPENHLIMTGSHASSFRDSLVSKVVAKQNPERAQALANADTFTIVAELTDDGVLKYEIETDHLGESIVALGPNLLQRFVTSSQDSLFA